MYALDCKKGHICHILSPCLPLCWCPATAVELSRPRLPRNLMDGFLAPCSPPDACPTHTHTYPAYETTSPHLPCPPLCPTYRCGGRGGGQVCGIGRGKGRGPRGGHSRSTSRGTGGACCIDLEQLGTHGHRIVGVRVRLHQHARVLGTDLHAHLHTTTYTRTELRPRGHK